MNHRTSKLIRRFAATVQSKYTPRQDYQRHKKEWNALPRPLRHKARLILRVQLDLRGQ